MIYFKIFIRSQDYLLSIDQY